MKLATSVRMLRIFDRYRVRIAIGVFFSILVHGLILSLHLGIPGLGLPGIDLPWQDRKVEVPDLSIRIANSAQSSTIKLQLSPQLQQVISIPKPQQAPVSNNQPLTDLPNAQLKQKPTSSALQSMHLAKSLQSIPAIAKNSKKNGAAPLHDQSAPVIAQSTNTRIALTGDYPDSFVIPAPDAEDLPHPAPKSDKIPVSVRPVEEKATPAIAVQSKPTADAAERPTPAVQKPAIKESFEQPEQNQAMQPEDSKESEPATSLAKNEQGEEIAEQEARRKQEEQLEIQRAKDIENQKREEKLKADEEARQLAEKKLEEEQNARRAEEMAEKRREEIKRQEQEEAQRQEKEAEAKKQAEEQERNKAAALALQMQLEEQKRAEDKRRQEKEKAEKLAAELEQQKQAEEKERQKRAALEKQKQDEQIAAAKKAQEEQVAQAAQAARKALEAAQKQENEARIQRENARVAAEAAAAAAAKAKISATSSATQSSMPSNRVASDSGTDGNKNQASATGKGNLASNALEQIGKMNFSDMDSESTDHHNHVIEDTRPHSIIGIHTHEPVIDSYIRDWCAKIERNNGSLNYSQSSAELAREDPLVTVVIRSDGTVESISIDRKSGRKDLDEAVRRIVHFYEPYSAFQASLAAKGSTITITRIWHFGETLKIQEGTHQQ